MGSYLQFHFQLRWVRACRRRCLRILRSGSLTQGLTLVDKTWLQCETELKAARLSARSVSLLASRAQEMLPCVLNVKAAATAPGSPRVSQGTEHLLNCPLQRCFALWMACGQTGLQERHGRRRPGLLLEQRVTLQQAVLTGADETGRAAQPSQQPATPTAAPRRKQQCAPSPGAARGKRR